MPRLSIVTMVLSGLLLLVGFVAAAPNVLPQPAREAMANVGLQPLRLGLDLQGGSYLLLEVQVDEAVAERLANLREEVRDALTGRTVEGRRLGFDNLAVSENVVSVTVPENYEAAQDRLETLFEDAEEIAVETVPQANRLRVIFQEDALRELERSAVSQSIEIVRRRIDATGATQPTIQRQGARRIVVQVPGESDPQRIVDLLGQTARLSFHPVVESLGTTDPDAARSRPGTIIRQSRTGETLVLERRPVITGEMLTGARAQPSQDSPPFEVTFRLNTQGARAFGDYTRDNVGERFAIVLDEEVVSAPTIQSWIPGGSGRITGGFSQEEASDLAILLRAGALPAPLTVEERRTVGPDLGRDSVEAGRLAAIVGLVAVAAFMVLSYGRFGLFANAALFINLVLIFGALSLFQATLTLPGVAGIVLTIGMAVDANVLIFERIREEQRSGKQPLAAARTGFEAAVRAIVDANVTTLIVALILYQLGSGPVRGFAVTLAIGIATSMFCALILTRLMVSRYLRTTRPQSIPSLA